MTKKRKRIRPEKWTYQDSPVAARCKELLQGDNSWPGSMAVVKNLQKAAMHLASGKYTWCNNDHIETMAVLGCGHEETMKYWQIVCRQNGWLK